MGISYGSGEALRRGLSCLMAVLLSGCATVFTGTKDTLRFDTEPQGAELSINGESICRTPCQASVRRSLGSRTATLRLEGYREERFRLDTDLNYVSLANLSFLIGWAIDIATGAIIRYDRREYRFELRPDLPSRQTGWKHTDATDRMVLPKSIPGQPAKD
jgi:hypothetical protein